MVYVVLRFVFSGHNGNLSRKQREIIHFTPLTPKIVFFLFIVIFENDFSIFTFACFFLGGEKFLRKGKVEKVWSWLSSFVSREWQKNFLTVFWLSREIFIVQQWKRVFVIFFYWWLIVWATHKLDLFPMIKSKNSPNESIVIQELVNFLPLAELLIANTRVFVLIKCSGANSWYSQSKYYIRI